MSSLHFRNQGRKIILIAEGSAFGIFVLEKNMLSEKIIMLSDIIAEFIKTVSINLSDDIDRRLRDIADSESNPTAKKMYSCILDDLELSRKLNRPICQDTGVLQFFVEIGTDCPFIKDIERAITIAAEKATEKTPLRPNIVDPLGEMNTGNNTGYNTPYIEYKIIPDSSDLIIKVYLSGGGCALPGRSRVLMPLEGKEGIKKFVYETIAEWGVNACPPLFVGIGIGACAVTAANLSKKALLRPVDSENDDKETADFEKEIEDGLNSLGIAPLGFGGDKTVLGVNIETAGRHPATLGVGISTGCWATRKGEIVIKDDLSFDIPSHKRLKEETK